MQPAAHITILMAVYNGANYLAQQLDSLADQTDTDWRLLAGDDNSDDDSRAILGRFAARHESRVDILEGPGQGGAAHFMFLLRHLAEHRTPQACGGIAFADQDDVWLPDKLAAARTALAKCDPDTPALYCGRTWITNTDLSQRRLSAPRPRPPSFANALVQNIAAGNTIVLNRAATQLVLDMALKTDRVVVHDWWIYQLITGAGGRVIHDDTPYVLYRQHGANQIGANDRTAGRLRRLGQLLRGDMGKWNRINVAALNGTQDVLTPENRALLSDFAALPTLPLHRRLIRLWRMTLYRQTRASTAALWIAAFLRKI